MPTENDSLLGSNNAQNKAAIAGREIESPMDNAKEAGKNTGQAAAILGAHTPLHLAVSAIGAGIAYRRTAEKNSQTLSARQELIDTIAEGGFENGRELEKSLGENASPQLKQFYSNVHTLSQANRLDTYKEDLKEKIGKSNTEQGMEEAKLSSITAVVSEGLEHADNIEVTRERSDSDKKQKAPRFTGNDPELSPLLTETAIDLLTEDIESQKSARNGASNAHSAMGYTSASAPLTTAASLTAGAISTVAAKKLDEYTNNGLIKDLLDRVNQPKEYETIQQSDKLPDNLKDFFKDAHEVASNTDPDNWKEIKSGIKAMMSALSFEDAQNKLSDIRYDLVGPSHDQSMQLDISLNEEGELADVDDDFFNSVADTILFPQLSQERQPEISQPSQRQDVSQESSERIPNDLLDQEHFTTFQSVRNRLLSGGFQQNGSSNSTTHAKNVIDSNPPNVREH